MGRHRRKGWGAARSKARRSAASKAVSEAAPFPAEDAEESAPWAVRPGSTPDPLSRPAGPDAGYSGDDTGDGQRSATEHPNSGDSPRPAGVPYPRRGGSPGTPPHGVPGAAGPHTPASGFPSAFPRQGGPRTPAHGSPALGDPAGDAGPDARGGHPQQWEPGGGWGASGRGRGPEPGGWPHRDGEGDGQSSGPRQEYLDAFDDDVFAAGAPGSDRSHRTADPEAPQGPRVPGQRHPGQGLEEPERHGDGPPDGHDDPAPLAPIPPPRRRGGRGRTYTGIAAAAVTTVLAVLVAGQVTDENQGGGRADGAPSTDRAGGADQASRGDAEGRDKPSESPAKKKRATYGEKMAKRFPVAPGSEGAGTFTTVGGREKGTGKGSEVRYRIDVEKGLPLEARLFAKAVHKTLNDERSWAHDGRRTFERVSSGRADFVITLASPKTTGVWCEKSALNTLEDNVSCDSAATERIMINAYRWAQGAKTYGADRMHSYRQMLINHEVGHRLGRGHESCERDGALAPVMMQQTKFLTTDGNKCRPNAWPHPRG